MIAGRRVRALLAVAVGFAAAVVGQQLDDLRRGALQDVLVAARVLAARQPHVRVRTDGHHLRGTYR